MNTPGQNANAVAELVFGHLDKAKASFLEQYAVCSSWPLNEPWGVIVRRGLLWKRMQTLDCWGMMIVSARNNFDGTSGFELVNREIAFYGFGAVARAVHKLAQGHVASICQRLTIPSITSIWYFFISDVSVLSLAGFGMQSFAYDPYIPADQIKVGYLPRSSRPHSRFRSFCLLSEPGFCRENFCRNSACLV